MAGCVGAGLQRPGGAREEHREPRSWLGGSATPSPACGVVTFPSSSRCSLLPRPSAWRPAAPRCRPCPDAITTSSPTLSASASPTLDATDAAIIAAYDAYWSAVNQANAATSGTGAWNVPALSSDHGQPPARSVAERAHQQEAQGIFVQGTFTAAAPARDLQHGHHGGGFRLCVG